MARPKKSKLIAQDFRHDLRIMGLNNRKVSVVREDKVIKVRPKTSQLDKIQRVVDKYESSPDLSKHVKFEVYDPEEVTPYPGSIMAVDIPEPLPVERRQPENKFAMARQLIIMANRLLEE